MANRLPDVLKDDFCKWAALWGPAVILDGEGKCVSGPAGEIPACRASLSLDGVYYGSVHAASQDVADALAAIAEQYLRSELLQRDASQAQSRLIEEIRLRTELEEALKFMELKALQSQVNPHFLFNTLTTIAGMSAIEGAEQTQLLLMSMARLLRYSLRMIGQSVTLREEMDNVKDYLTIQQARFGDRIEVEINIQGGLEGASIPVLTLQPIVENAIIHGLESLEEGRLTLSAQLEGQVVRITVEDTGVGIDTERLQELRSFAGEGTGRGHTTGIGLDNVRRRLEHFFGTSSGFHLDSELGRGTRITLFIPHIE